MDGQNKQDETDLLVISKSIKSGIINLFKSINQLIDFSIKNIGMLLIFVIIGIGAAIGLHSIKKPVYSYSMCLSHQRLDNDNCGLLIKGLGSLIDASSTDIVAKSLNISVEKAKTLNEIKYKTLNTRVEKLYSDSAHVILPFEVIVDVKDKSVLDTLQKGILFYLESNEYATRLKAIDKSTLDNLEAKLNKDLSQLDSLKHIVDNSIIPRASGNGIILGEAIDPALIYKIDMELYKKFVDVKEKQALNNSFDIMMGFTPNLAGNSKGLFFYIIVGILISYMIGLLSINKRQKKAAAKE